MRHYNPATGTYGSVITSDTTQAGPYALIGVDDSAYRVVLMHTLDQDSYQIEVRNLSDGCLVGTPQVVRNSPGLVLGGRVDATRHQAWVLQWAGPDYHDELLNVDVATGAAGHPGRAGRRGEGDSAPTTTASTSTRAPAPSSWRTWPTARCASAPRRTR